MFAAADGYMQLHFEVDTSRFDSGALQFLDPATGSLAFGSADQAASYLVAKLQGNLQYDTSTSTWTLKKDVDLVGFELTASANMDQGSVDVLVGQAAFGPGAAPEPSTLLLLSVGVLGIVVWRRCTQRGHAVCQAPG
jgi:hypothetical protein